MIVTIITAVVALALGALAGFITSAISRKVNIMRSWILPKRTQT